jgi:hypothetical protein
MPDKKNKRRQKTIMVMNAEVSSTSRSSALIRKIQRKRSPVRKALIDYSKVALLQLPLQAMESSLVEGYTVVRGTKDRLKDMAECRNMADEDQGIRLFYSRIQKGALWFLLLDPDKKTVGYAWVMTTVNLSEDNDRYRLFCSPTQAYVFDTFIQPEERGKHLYGLLIGRLQQLLQAKGIDEYFVLVDSLNTISLKAHRKLGAIELETYRYTCFLGITFQTLWSKQQVKRKAGFFLGPSKIESLVLPSPELQDFSLFVQVLDNPNDWFSATSAVSHLEQASGDTLSPFHLFSAARIWWESDIKERYPLYLIGFMKEKKLEAYGLFRLVFDTQRVGKPKVLIAFDDLYFMDNCFFIHTPGLNQYMIQKMLEQPFFVKEIRRQTGADLLAWHRLPSKDLVWMPPSNLTRWAIKGEAEYPLLEIQDEQSFLSSQMAGHALRDIKKQEKRIKNAFGEVPQVQGISLGLLGSEAFAGVEEQFLVLLRKTWQYKWMEESPKVDTALYEFKLREYSKVWAGSGYPFVYFLNLGERHIAFLYALKKENRCYCLMIGYDPEFKTYSPGKTVFLGMLKDLSSQGVQQFHLGGNVVGWKDDWQSSCPQIYIQEFFLNRKFIVYQGLKALLKR